MTIKVRIPSMLRDYCGDRRVLTVTGPTIAAALEQLKQNHDALYHSICDETGTLRPHLGLFVNKELIDVRDKENLNRPLFNNDELTVWTAVSGG